MKHKQVKFSGTIRFVSLSPHSDPEGVVLDDGTFVKAPPHSLVDKKLFKVGAAVSGAGELIGESPNRVFHHAKLQSGARVLADDSVDKAEREKLKEAHEADLETREDAKDQAITLKGKLAAVATKPKGEIDRLIFEDGTSVHVPKHLELEDCEIGARFEVKGKARAYGDARFVKADSVRAL